MNSCQNWSAPDAAPIGTAAQVAPGPVTAVVRESGTAGEMGVCAGREALSPRCPGGLRTADRDPGDGQHREDRQNDQPLVQQRRPERGDHRGIVDVQAAIHPGHGAGHLQAHGSAPPGTTR